MKRKIDSTQLADAAYKGSQHKLQFFERWNTMITVTRSKIGQPALVSATPVSLAHAESTLSNFSKASLGNGEYSDECTAAARAIEAKQIDDFDLARLKEETMQQCMANYFATLPASIRPLVERLDASEVMESVLGLPGFVGRPELIVHARLQRAKFVALLSECRVDDSKLCERAEELLLDADTVECWLFGMGWHQGANAFPESGAECVALLKHWLDGVSMYTEASLATLEKCCGYPTDDGETRISEYSRCMRAQWELSLDDARDLLRKAKTTRDILTLVKCNLPEFMLVSIARRIKEL